MEASQRRVGWGRVGIMQQHVGFIGVLLVAGLLSGCVTGGGRKGLSEALMFHAPFDGTVDASFGAGDRRMQMGPTWNAPRNTTPGLPPGETVRLDRGAGKYGDALRFEKKITELVGYRVPGNFPFKARDWSGTVSFWLRVSPDADLEPGYCDVIQVTSKAWDDASFFVEFTKDEVPREMRLGVYADKKVWNPTNRKWEEIPMSEKPLARVLRPPFRRDLWTQVTFTWERFNTGRADGVARLYLDGEFQGEISAREQTFTWDLEQSVMMLGLAYTGWMDDLAVFRRALTPGEIRELYRLPGGVTDLHR